MVHTLLCVFCLNILLQGLSVTTVVSDLDHGSYLICPDDETAYLKIQVSLKSVLKPVNVDKYALGSGIVDDSLSVIFIIACLRSWKRRITETNVSLFLESDGQTYRCDEILKTDWCTIP